jgi:rhodanese-related sulfurtransferase
MPDTTPLEITAPELAKRFCEPNPPVVLDVREDNERAAASLPGTLHIRLRELPGKIDRLDSSAEIVVHCHHGMRSMQAVQFLRQNGFPHARNLTGGIAAWTREVDPTVPDY